MVIAGCTEARDIDARIRLAYGALQRWQSPLYGSPGDPGEAAGGAAVRTLPFEAWSARRNHAFSTYRKIASYPANRGGVVVWSLEYILHQCDGPSP